MTSVLSCREQRHPPPELPDVVFRRRMGALLGGQALPAGRPKGKSGAAISTIIGEGDLSGRLSPQYKAKVILAQAADARPSKAGQKVAPPPAPQGWVE